MTYPPPHFEYSSGDVSGAMGDNPHRNLSLDLQRGATELTRQLFHEEAYRLLTRIEHTQPYNTRSSPTGDGRVFELTHMEHRTGNHKTADAMVYVPNGFDASKPVKLMIYNHGLETNAQRTFKQTLAKQMAGADSNTIVVVPEWQTQPDSRISPVNSKFNEPQFFRKMLGEIMSKTPPLHNLKVDDISNIGVITHSGGYLSAMSEMYRNGLYNKVTSLTVLDSLYNPKAFDRWIDDNINDLASGKKQLQVVYTDHLSNECLGLASRIRQSLHRHRLSESNLYIDHGSSQAVLNSDTFSNHGIVFKKSDYKIKNETAHSSMTEVYVREILASQNPSLRRTREMYAPRYQMTYPNY